MREARAPRPRRTCAVIVTLQDAATEARLMAPALRACQAAGDELRIYVLPAGEESSVDDAAETVCQAFGVEHAELIPAPRPAAARGAAHMEMRHAYRAYEFLKTRVPDVVISTQALGTLYFALRARELGVGFQRTRFVVVLAPFELQRRLNERLVTSRPSALIRFHLERVVAENADVCAAPSHRFVENAVRTGAAAQRSPFVVLPEIEAVSVVSDAAPGRPTGFVIPDAPPLARNIAFFATVAKRRPEALRDPQGRIRLHVDVADSSGKIAAQCEERLAGTEVAWTAGSRDADVDSGEAMLFAPYCEDFFALGASLAPAVLGAPVLVGTGSAVGEPFEAAGVAVEPFPDVVAEALTGAAEGRRALRVTARQADREASWSRFFGNLAPPRPVEVSDPPLVTACIMHFNRPDLVKQALSSALGQTCENLEILIFDDGSNAAGAVGELETLVEAHAGRIRLVRQDNRYLGAARNRAARAAGGEYVYFLDDDNVLKPEAIETLVHAARVSGADFIGSFSDIFTGGSMPDPAKPAERRILQTGGDAGFSLFQNTILDGNALCRREAFLDLGGNTEDYGIGKEDQEFFARAVRSGCTLAIVPEALLWARHGTQGLKSLHFDWNAGHFRVLEAYWPVVAPEYRALLVLLQGMFLKRIELREEIETLLGKLESLSNDLEISRKGHVMALARRPSRLGVHRLEVGILLNPEWVAHAWQDRSPDTIFELRRNGRVVARTRFGEARGTALQIVTPPRGPVLGDVIYSIHDISTGETLAACAQPAFWRARRIVGAVENQPRPLVRGWVFDPANPDRSRRIAIHVDGRLSEVIAAGEHRADIARWKGTEGGHGFVWQIGDGPASVDGTRIDVFDAGTGRALDGSPIRIEDGRAVATGQRRT